MFAVPLLEVADLYNLTFLNAFVSLLTISISSVLKIFVTCMKLSIVAFVVVLFALSKSLVLSIVTY